MARIRFERRRGRGVLGAFVLATATATGTTTGEAADGEASSPVAAPAVVVRAVHPDQQARAVLKLFDGARAASPAAAMAAWRRATADLSKVSKPLQAVAAIFNPEMVAEWKAFHGVELAVGFDPADAQPRWRMTAPEDDGVLAALITSLRLSGGGSEPPVGEPPVVVERLGGPGAAVAARLPEGAVFAGRRAELASAVASLRAGAGLTSGPLAELPEGLGGSGFTATLDPSRIDAPAAANLLLARIESAARAGGLKTTIGRLALVDDHLDLNLSTDLAPELRLAAENQPTALDPRWLACVPADSVQAAASFALGRGAPFWNRVFEVADKIEKTDPTHAQTAPLRVRINLLGLARGARLEADLWPMLRGVTAAALAEPTKSGRTSGVLLALHADRPEDADRILSRVVVRLAGKGGKAGEPGSGTLTLGDVQGRPLEAAVRGSTVLVGWGAGTLARGLASIDAPERSASTAIAAASTAAGRPVSRAGLYWPGRLTFPIAGFRPPSPLTASLAEGSPIVWTGGDDDGRAWNLASWPDLRRLVARFLDRVPQAPPAAP